MLPQAHPRSRPPRDPTPARVLGFAGVAGLMIVLVVTIGLIAGAGGDDEQEVAAQPTPAATASPTPTPRPRRTPVPLSADERAERDAAVAVVESRGYVVERARRDWNPDADLKALIGTSPEGGQLAFFFVNGDYLGNDSTETSGRIRVEESDGLEVTLSYGIYEPGDELSEPTGTPVPIQFRYDGATLEPVQSLPLINERSQPLP